MRTVTFGLAVALMMAVVPVVAGPPGAVAGGTPVATVGLVDPTTGEWHLRGAAGWVTSFVYGDPGDDPMIGDWDCDGVETPGLYRRSDGFVYLRNSNAEGIADVQFFFGNAGDIPLAGDFDADGCDTVSLYRPTSGQVFIINELGSASEGVGAAEVDYHFGNPGDKPFVGDFDGDGVETIGLHRESTGLVYFRNSHTEGAADDEFFFGNPDDRIVAGDWGIVDGIATPAVFRPSDTTFYFRHSNTPGNADGHLVIGEAGWHPVAGRFGLPVVPFDQRTWSRVTVDSGGDVGRFNSIEIGADGLPLIAYGRSLALAVQELRVIHCTDVWCGGATTTALGSTMFESTSIAFDERGLPMITFFDPWAPGLAITSCVDAACRTAATRFGPFGGAYGKSSEAAFAGDGAAVIVASNSGSADTLTRPGTSAPWKAQTIDPSWGRPSLGMGPDGIARILIPGRATWSALDEQGFPKSLTYPLVLATCGDSACTFGLTSRVVIHEETTTAFEARHSGESARAHAHTSVAVSDERLPVAAISWRGGPGLEAIACADPACSSRAVTLIDDRNGAGKFVDIAFTPDRRPIMAYADGAGAVRVAHCEDASCSSVTIATVAEPGAGTEVSFALDRLGVPVVAYYDRPAGDLVVARMR